MGMTLEAIKQAIAELPEPEKTSLVAWLKRRGRQGLGQANRGRFFRGWRRHGFA